MWRRRTQGAQVRTSRAPRAGSPGRTGARADDLGLCYSLTLLIRWASISCLSSVATRPQEERKTC
jgi:hypothetical protein